MVRIESIFHKERQLQTKIILDFCWPTLLLLFNMNPQNQYRRHHPYTSHYPIYYPHLDPYYCPYWSYQLPYPMPPYESRQLREQKTLPFKDALPTEPKPRIVIKSQPELENTPLLVKESSGKKQRPEKNCVSKQSKQVVLNKKDESLSQPQKNKKKEVIAPVVKIQQPDGVQPQKHVDKQNLDTAKLILKMFQSFSLDPVQYNSVSNYLIDNQIIEKEFVQMLDEKIKTFRKSKEEMIKITIRKAQKFYKTIHRCKRDDRFVKYGGFKSMNTMYLETMFSDPRFVQAFQCVAETFKEEYEAENFKKIETICDLIGNQKVKNNKQLFIQIISEKNKMPWPKFWINKLMRNIHWIYVNFTKEYMKKEVAIAIDKDCS